ncbi:hypothetical protein EJB05_44752, partial [Eragrostis curvula]
MGRNGLFHPSIQRKRAMSSTLRNRIVSSCESACSEGRGESGGRDRGERRRWRREATVRRPDPSTTATTASSTRRPPSPGCLSPQWHGIGVRRGAATPLEPREIALVRRSAPLPSACAAAANRAPTGERESSARTPAWQRSPSPSARSTPAVALCELHAICRN